MGLVNRKPRGSSEHLKAYQFKTGQNGKGTNALPDIVDQKMREMLEADDGKKAQQLVDKMWRKAMRGDIKSQTLFLERTQGKPVQKMEIQAKPTDELTPEELDRKWIEYLASLEDHELERMMEARRVLRETGEYVYRPDDWTGAPPATETTQ